MSKKARGLFKIMSGKVASTIPNSGNPSSNNDPALKYKLIAKCSTTKARVGVMTLRHGDVDTPVFMPVGTQVRFEPFISNYFIFRPVSSFFLFILF